MIVRNQLRTIIPLFATIFLVTFSQYAMGITYMEGAVGEIYVYADDACFPLIGIPAEKTYHLSQNPDTVYIPMDYYFEDRRVPNSMRLQLWWHMGARYGPGPTGYYAAHWEFSEGANAGEGTFWNSVPNVYADTSIDVEYKVYVHDYTDFVCYTDAYQTFHFVYP